MRARFTNMRFAAIRRLSLVVMLIASPTMAQDDPVEREFDFVDRTSQATDLYNAGRLEEALTAFRSLVQCCSDLDTDAFVALSVGDCLARLERFDEARAAYQAAVSAHPEKAAVVEERLGEMDANAPVTPESIERLRVAANQPGAGSPNAQWRLARALQKQSMNLLTEAAGAFRQVSSASEETVSFRASALRAHVAYLEEVMQDLGRLIQWTEAVGQIDRGSGLGAQPRLGNCETITAERRHLKELLRDREGRRFEVEIVRETADATPRFTVDGTQLALTPEERQLIQRHQERIDALILEAAARQKAQPAN